MRVIKTFEDYFNGNTSESEENYPAGTASDPMSPWNKEDSETDRNISMNQSDIKFDLVASDYSEYAILKEKATGKMFVVAFEPNEMEDYVEFEKIPAGKDEEGMEEYEYEYKSPDKYAIEAFTTDKARESGTGKGMEGFKNSMVTELDKELAEDLYKSFEEFVDKYRNVGYRKEEIGNVEDIMSVLKEFLASL